MNSSGSFTKFIVSMKLGKREGEREGEGLNISAFISYTYALNNDLMYGMDFNTKTCMEGKENK
jgi:hypothetical protein